MIIETQFNLEDTVWFTNNNQITSGEVKQVCTCTDTGINYLILVGEEGISLFEDKVFATEEEARGCIIL